MTINNQQRLVIENSLGKKLREIGIIGGMSISEIGSQRKLYITINAKLSEEEKEQIDSAILSSGEFNSITGIEIHCF